MDFAAVQISASRKANADPDHLSPPIPPESNPRKLTGIRRSADYRLERGAAPAGAPPGRAASGGAVPFPRSRLLALSLCLASFSSCKLERPGFAGGLHRYKAVHYAAIPRGARPSTWKALQRSVLASGLLLAGDIHDDRALHEGLLDLCDRLAGLLRPLVLHVEFLGVEDEAACRSFLEGRRTLSELRSLIEARWPGSWLEGRGFDGSFYLDLMRFARERGIPVRALEPIPRLPLHLRDEGMARRLRRARQEFPGSLHIAIVGHSHLLGAGHLARRLEDLAPSILLPRCLPRAPGETDPPLHTPPLRLGPRLFTWRDQRPGAAVLPGIPAALPDPLRGNPPRRTGFAGGSKRRRLTFPSKGS